MKHCAKYEGVTVCQLGRWEDQSAACHYSRRSSRRNECIFMRTEHRWCSNYYVCRQARADARNPEGDDDTTAGS